MLRLIGYFSKSYAKRAMDVFCIAIYFITIQSIILFSSSSLLSYDEGNSGAIVALFLSAIISMPLIFEKDDEEGFLEQYLLLHKPTELLVLAKSISHWICCIFPIILCSLAGGWLTARADIGPETMLATTESLIVGTLALQSVITLVAALSLSQKARSMVSAIIAIPLMIPILIFTSAAASGKVVELQIVAAICCVLTPTCIWASAAALKAHIKS